MGNGDIVKQFVEQGTLGIHTGFFGKVLSVDTKEFTAKVQPLHMYKSVGGTAKKHAVLPSVPIMHNVRKWGKRTIKFTDEDMWDGDTTAAGVVSPKFDNSHGHSFDVFEPNMIETGDIVYCVCADRDITQTKKGKTALPSLGHHNLTDAVIVSVVENREFIYEEETILKKEPIPTTEKEEDGDIT